MTELSQETRRALDMLIHSGRLPHTVIIEGDERAQRDAAVMYLTCAAVCREKDAPCMRCDQCRKALDRAHPDIIIPLPSKKTKTNIIPLQELRDEYLSQASIVPNESDTKVYLFFDADSTLREDAQNTLLKLIEEPPQSMLFLFSVERAENLLATVRSRAHTLTLSSSAQPDENVADIAQDIAQGLVSLHEYELMLALFYITKENLVPVLTEVRDVLRRCLLHLSGVLSDDSVVRTLTRRLTRERLLQLIDVTGTAIEKSQTNIGTDLLITWLCTQYRRIAWQK